MFRSRSFTAGVLALAATLQLAASGATVSDSKFLAVTSPATAIVPHTPPGERQFAFNKVVDDYFMAAFNYHPNWATAVGFHEWDHKLQTYSQAGIKTRIAELNQFKTKLNTFDNAQLNKTSQLDKQMLLSNANSELLDLEQIQNWKRDPDKYSSACTEGIFDLVKRTFGTPEERLQAVIAREKLIPGILENARANLSATPRIYTEIALEQLPGSISFFRDTVPKAFASVSNPVLLAELKKSNDEAISSLEDYQKFVKDTILPKSIEQFAIGKDSYEKKLAYDEMVTDSLHELLAKGEIELHRLQKAFNETAHDIDPTKSPHDVYASISSSHPKPDELIASVTSVLANLRDKSKQIVTIPAEADLKVQETPPFMRAVTFASMDTPGPFEEKAKEAYYQVTLPEKDWNAEKTEQHMRFFCKDDLINTSVHEAYPGHYVQGLWMRQAPSKTRKLLYCGTNSEGWAHYCEEMMVDEGLSGTDKGLKLVQLHDALLRASRYIVGIKMHTQGMTMDEAREFFVKEGYQEPANADRETKRGTNDPTYCVYTLGKLKILELRKEYQKSKGNNYSLKNFHDDFLAQGCAPIYIVRQAILETK